MKKVKTNLNKPTGISEKVINIIAIINKIEQEGAYPSIQTLANLCEVSVRTAYRYLNIINKIIPVFFDKNKNGYRFELKSSRKFYGLSNSDIAFFTVMSDILEQVGEPLKTEFQLALKRFITLEDRSNVMKISNVALAVDLDEIKFKNLFTAISNKKKVLIKYKSANDMQTERTVNPIMLFFHDGIWFLYGYCNYREDFRWFALDRMISVEPLNEGFVPPEKKFIDDRFKKSFKFWQSDSEVLVRVVFSEKIASIIRRKKKWHNSEVKKVLNDGSVELTMRVSHIEEVKWWLYSWIPHVRILEPESLRDTMINEMKQTLDSWK